MLKFQDSFPKMQSFIKNSAVFPSLITMLFHSHHSYRRALYTIFFNLLIEKCMRLRVISTQFSASSVSSQISESYELE